jgi:hypothetical protein
LAPRDPATGSCHGCPFVWTVVLDLAWWGAGGERTSATRPFGRGDSNTKVNRQFGALTRHTRPDLLPRHRDSSKRVLWLVSVPSRQGGAEKVRNSSKGSICQKFCSAGFKAEAAFWWRALTTTGAVGPAGPSDGILPRLSFCLDCGSRLGLAGGRWRANERNTPVWTRGLEHEGKPAVWRPDETHQARSVAKAPRQLKPGALVGLRAV